MVLTDKGPSLPVLAEIPCVVVKEVRLATEVVPVMGIDALSLVVGLDVWTPLGLEVVHVECSITWHLMDESRLDVFVRVCERAELLVVTDVTLVSAELGLVLLDVV